MAGAKKGLVDTCARRTQLTNAGKAGLLPMTGAGAFLPDKEMK